MNPLLLGVLGYIIVQLLIGLAVSRRVKSEDDYLLAGRSMGYVLSTASIFATWFGAESCVSAAGSAYSDGLSWTSTEPYAYGVALALAGVWLAMPLWSRKLTTLADLFRTRYSEGVERLAALLLIPTSVFWAAAQIRAFGHVIASVSEMNFVVATSVAAGVVVLYTTTGGMLADAVTDVVQGIALVVGLGVMLFVIVGDMGGAGAALGSLDAARFDFAADGGGSSWLEIAEAWSAPLLGSLVAQELIARMSSARSGVVARRSSVVAGLIYVLVGSIPVVLGLLGPSLMPGIADPEQILPELARTKLSTLGFILFAGALVSAILSTVDSALLVSSALLSHNLVGRVWPRSSERAKVRVARLGVIGFGLLAFALALAVSSVSELIDLTNGFGSAGIFVLLVFGLFTRFGGRASAFGALTAGALTFIAGYFGGWSYTYLAAVTAALGAYVLLGLVAPKSALAASR